jgi:hypothetical protein
MTTSKPSRSSRAIGVVAVATLISISAGVTGAQAAQWLSPLAAAGHWMLTEEGIVQQGSPNDVRQGPLSAEDQALAKRWAELFANVLVEFKADNRDPIANIEGDFSTRELRIRRTVGEDQWVDRTLTKKELATADLRALAKRLYEESKKQ